MQTQKACVLHRLQPHALPDPCTGGVPDKLGFLLPELLAPCNALILYGVIDLHPYMLLFPGEKSGDVKRKRRLASHMAAHTVSVDKDPALVVHCPETKQHPFSSPAVRDLKSPLISHPVLPDPLADAA